MKIQTDFSLYLLVCNSHAVIKGHHRTGFCCHFWKQSFSSTGNERDIHVHPTRATGHGISDWLQFSFSRSATLLGQSPILQYNNKANKNNNNKTKLLLLLLFKTSIWNSFPSSLPYVPSILSKLIFGGKFGLTWKNFFFFFLECQSPSTPQWWLWFTTPSITHQNPSRSHQAEVAGMYMHWGARVLKVKHRIFKYSMQIKASHFTNHLFRYFRVSESIYSLGTHGVSILQAFTHILSFRWEKDCKIRPYICNIKEIWGEEKKSLPLWFIRIRKKGICRNAGWSRFVKTVYWA